MFLQIIRSNVVLSSNTKKGEIERTFLSLCVLMFDDNTISGLTCVLIASGDFFMLLGALDVWVSMRA